MFAKQQQQKMSRLQYPGQQRFLIHFFVKIVLIMVMLPNTHLWITAQLDSSIMTATPSQAETDDCLVEMLRSNVDSNQALNFAEFLNWMMYVSPDRCLTIDHLTNSIDLARQAYVQIACSCNEYPNDIGVLETISCRPCQEMSLPDTIAIALPGIYPFGEYPGSYAMNACIQVIQITSDLCKQKQTTTTTSFPSIIPTSAPVAAILDTPSIDTLDKTALHCLSLMLQNNVDGNLYLNYAEFLSWVVDMSDGCLSTSNLAQRPDVVSALYFGSYADIACTCSNYPQPTAPALQEIPCVSCNDQSFDSQIHIALPGTYPEGVYPGQYVIDICQKLQTVVEDLCLETIAAPIASDSSLSSIPLTFASGMPTSSPVLAIVDTPANLNNINSSTQNRIVSIDQDHNDSTGTNSHLGLVLGIVIPLLMVGILLAVFITGRYRAQSNPLRFQSLNHDTTQNESNDTILMTSSKSCQALDLSETEITNTEVELEDYCDVAAAYCVIPDNQTYDRQSSQFNLDVTSLTATAIDHFHPSTLPQESPIFRLPGKGKDNEPNTILSLETHSLTFNAITSSSSQSQQYLDNTYTSNGVSSSDSSAVIIFLDDTSVEGHLDIDEALSKSTFLDKKNAYDPKHDLEYVNSESSDRKENCTKEKSDITSDERERAMNLFAALVGIFDGYPKERK